MSPRLRFSVYRSRISINRSQSHANLRLVNNSAFYISRASFEMTSIARFRQCQHSMRERLLKLPMEELRNSVPRWLAKRGTKSEWVEYLITPQLTFHTTRNVSVPSIVPHGFLASHMTHPETGLPVGERFGLNLLGDGIYLSPDAEYTLIYTPQWTWSKVDQTEADPAKPGDFWGSKLIVCATIMGRPITVPDDESHLHRTEPLPGRIVTSTVTKMNMSSLTAHRYYRAMLSIWIGATEIGIIPMLFLLRRNSLHESKTALSWIHSSRLQAISRERKRP